MLAGSASDRRAELPSNCVAAAMASVRPEPWLLWPDFMSNATWWQTLPGVTTLRRRSRLSSIWAATAIASCTSSSASSDPINGI